MTDTVTARAPRRRTGRIHGAVLLGYLLLTVLMTWPLATQFNTAIPGDGFDGWQNFWNQWWIKVALIDQQRNPLRTDLLFHPTGVTLYFHTLNPFNGLTTLPVQLAFGLIPAYNAAVFLAWVLGGYGVFLLTLDQLAIHNSRFSIVSQRYAADAGFDRLSRRQSHNADAGSDRLSRRQLHSADGVAYWAAFLAGAIFTFSPFHMAHLLGHMQVMSLQWLPFYALYLLRALTAVKRGRPWLREGLLAALFLILVGLCDWYFVLYLVFFTGLAILWSWLGTPTRSTGSTPGWRARLLELARLLLPALLAGALFFIALSFWLAPMLAETRAFSFMVRPAQDLYILSASVMDFLVPNRLHTLFRPESFSWIGNQIAPVSERTISIGYVALALAALGALLGRRRAGLWILGAIFFFFMALGPVIHLGNITAADIPEVDELPLHFTPFGILAYFSDFVRLSRSVSRYAVMVQLCVAVLAGIGVAGVVYGTRIGRIGRIEPDSNSKKNQISSARSAQSAFYLPALFLILILSEYWVAPFPMSPPDTPAWYGTLAQEPGDGAVLNLPMNYDRPGYLLYQTVHQRPLTVAYISRDDPRTLTERAPVLQHFRHLGPDILQIDPATVGMTVLHDLEVEYVVLDRYKMPGGLERTYTTELAAAIFHNRPAVYEDERITVYRVDSPQTALPYAMLGALNWGPLTTTDGSETARALLGPTEITLHHLPADARLRLRYRTAGDASARVTIGPATYELTAASGGTAFTAPLGSLPAADGGTVAIAPSGPGEILIEEIEILAP